MPQGAQNARHGGEGLGARRWVQRLGVIAGAVGLPNLNRRTRHKAMQKQVSDPCRLNRPSPKVRREKAGERRPEAPRCDREASTPPREPRPSLRLSASTTTRERVGGSGDWSRGGNREGEILWAGFLTMVSRTSSAAPRSCEPNNTNGDVATTGPAHSFRCDNRHSRITGLFVSIHQAMIRIMLHRLAATPSA